MKQGMEIFRELNPDPELVNMAVKDFSGLRDKPVRRYTFKRRNEILAAARKKVVKGSRGSLRD